MAPEAMSGVIEFFVQHEHGEPVIQLAVCIDGDVALYLETAAELDAFQGALTAAGEAYREIVENNEAAPTRS